MISLFNLLSWLFGDWGSPHSPNATPKSTTARFNGLNVPNYRPGSNEDSIDLQVKSLLYVFHRLQLGSLCPFIMWDDDNEEYKLDFYPSKTPEGVLMTPRLDKVYNIEGFKLQLINDPHRVLVDWAKNKARSMFILSSEPETVKIPHLNLPNFHFVILPSNSNDNDYINALVHNSGIYAEHRVSVKVRTQCALKALNKQRQRNNNNLFSMDDRAEIIEGYLKRLAIHVQVHRLYNATLRAQEKDRAKNISETIGTYKSMKAGSSGGGGGAGGNLGDYSDTTTSSALGHLFTNDEKTLWWDQSLMAVRLRVEKERYAL